MTEPTTTRRGALMAIGAAITGTPTASSSTIEVGIYATPRALLEGRFERLRLLESTIEGALEEAVPEADVTVEAERVDTVDTADSALETLRSWHEEPHHYADANLLVVSSETSEQWDHGGRGDVGGEASVVDGAGENRAHARWAALHEVGHNLGLTHDVGEVEEVAHMTTATAMASHDEIGRYECRFSDEAAQQLRNR